MSVVPLGGLLGVSAPGTTETFGPRFVRLCELANFVGEAEAAALLPVLIEPLRPADRGKLAVVLEEAIEIALERRGACPPGVGAATDLESSLGDQLYRARLVEVRGLCLFLASLEGAATLGGALDAEDSAVLRFWLEAARTRPVRLLLDESNRALAAYGAPIPLSVLVEAPADMGNERHETPPHVAPDVAASAETMELSETPPAVTPEEPDRATATGEPHLAGDMARALMHELTRTTAPKCAPFEPAPPSASGETPIVPPVFADESPTVHDAGFDVELAPTYDEISAVHALGSHRDTAPDDALSPIPCEVIARTETVVPPPAIVHAPSDAVNAVSELSAPVTPESEASDANAESAPNEDASVEAHESAPASAVPEASAPVTAEAEQARSTAIAEPASAPEEAPAASAVDGPLHPAAASEWQAWVRDLEAARGPKPLAVVERMFAMSYVPLRDAYLRGIAPREVGAILEGWAQSFAKSYREAFDALRVRGKRPTMVLDVPEAAHRIGRLHGARSVQLLLVDGLRFDLGLRVELGLRARLGREVALTERLLLWSALPSDTATQIELIGRGAEGLRELTGSPASEIPVARGRMAKTPRRIKAGHRELLKLDLVEARLSEPGGAESPRLDALGVEVTDAIAELCEKLPPRTLLFVFGDHGFRLEPRGEGTSALEQGGARPEEVLVPAFAWLVGGVQ
jgi:hypothetical protein